MLAIVTFRKGTFTYIVKRAEEKPFALQPRSTPDTPDKGSNKFAHRTKAIAIKWCWW
jgi:hypothetical protein